MTADQSIADWQQRVLAAIERGESVNILLPKGHGKASFVRAANELGIVLSDEAVQAKALELGVTEDQARVALVSDQLEAMYPTSNRP